MPAMRRDSDSNVAIQLYIAIKSLVLKAGNRIITNLAVV